MSKKNKTKIAYLADLQEKNDFVRKLSNNIVFNLKYFQSGKEYGQSFEDWEKNEYLADLNNKLKDFSGKKKIELLQDKTLEIYSSYPKGSRFKMPESLRNRDIKWARLRITGARRLIGFFVGEEYADGSIMEDAIAIKDVFYVVFLDKNHDFAPYVHK